MQKIKYTGILVILLFLTSCQNREKVIDNPDVNNLKWLEGTWQGNSGPATIREQWKSISSQSIYGYQFHIKNQDTVVSRSFQIEKGKNGIQLVMNNNSGEKPAILPLEKYMIKENKNYKSHYLSFKNKRSGAPKTIKYTKKAKDTLIFTRIINQKGDKNQYRFLLTRTKN